MFINEKKDICPRVEVTAPADGVVLLQGWKSDDTPGDLIVTTFEALNQILEQAKELRPGQ